MMAMHRPGDPKLGVERGNPADSGIRQTGLPANTKTTKRYNGKTGLAASAKTQQRISLQTNKRLNGQPSLPANTKTRQREYEQTLKQG